MPAVRAHRILFGPGLLSVPVVSKGKPPRKLPIMRTAGEIGAAKVIRAARVDHVVDLMTSGQWASARSIRALTTEWQVSIGAVQDYAREASGIIRHSLAGHEDEIRSQIIAGIDHVRETAMKLQKAVVVGKEVQLFDAPNCGAALAAYELQLRALGLITLKVEARDVTKMTKDEQLARWKELTGHDFEPNPSKGGE